MLLSWFCCSARRKRCLSSLHVLERVVRMSRRLLKSLWLMFGPFIRCETARSVARGGLGVCSSAWVVQLMSAAPRRLHEVRIAPGGGLEVLLVGLKMAVAATGLSSGCGKGSLSSGSGCRGFVYTVGVLTGIGSVPLCISPLRLLRAVSVDVVRMREQSLSRPLAAVEYRQGGCSKTYANL